MTIGDWSVLPRAPGETLDRLGVGSPVLAQLLVNRGIDGASASADFLWGRGEQGDPILLAGMKEALARIDAALRRDESIVVYGDYDVDGVSGATLLALALRAIGARVRAFIPHRDRDGYGLNSAVLTRLRAEGAGLIISVDCGVSAGIEIERAKRAGLDVIVTDHHHVPAELPAAVAVINPHRLDCPYPFKALAGAGVALRLAQVVVRNWAPAGGFTAIDDHLHELAMLGTVSDVMPLVGENREIVRRGLARMNTNPSPGIAALLRRAGLNVGWATAEHVAYKLAPRLNAAGRVADPELAHLLLVATTPAAAADIAEQLEVLNTRRRMMTEEAVGAARVEMEALDTPLPAALVLSGHYPAGVLGLVAARVAEEAQRPTAVLRCDPGLCRGSVRGFGSVDVGRAVAACADLLDAFGGHAAAAGLSIAPQLVEHFRARFIEAVTAQQSDGPSLERLRPGRVADCRLHPRSIDLALCDVLAHLEPCGEGNPTPLFETRGLRVQEARSVAGGHLRLRLAADGVRHQAIAFGGASRAPRPSDLIDVLFHVRRHRWRDVDCAELEVLDWRPSDS